VDFDLRSGEVMALLGENGAGKSTLMKVLSGVYQRDEGTLEIFGKQYGDLNPKLAQEVGMSPRNVIIGDIGRVIELTPGSARITGTVPSGRVFVDGYGVGDVGSVVLRDRKHLAEDGMIMVVCAMSAEDGALISGPDIVTRGFIYVKESEGLMEELRRVAVDAIEKCNIRYATDWAAIKTEVKETLSDYLYKKTKRNPMILPVIMEV